MPHLYPPDREGLPRAATFWLEMRQHLDAQASEHGDPIGLIRSVQPVYEVDRTHQGERGLAYSKTHNLSAGGWAIIAGVSEDVEDGAEKVKVGKTGVLRIDSISLSASVSTNIKGPYLTGWPGGGNAIAWIGDNNDSWAHNNYGFAPTHVLVMRYSPPLRLPFADVDLRVTVSTACSLTVTVVAAVEYGYRQDTHLED